jgi:hypothetical protein
MLPCIIYVLLIALVTESVKALFDFLLKLFIAWS